MSGLRIVFFGTADLACASLEALVRTPSFQVVDIVTQPDRPRGRDLKLAPPPVKLAAARLGLPVTQPEKCRHPDCLARIRAASPDVIVVAAYGQILPPALLGSAPHGGVNVHASLLPKYRGAAPIQWAMLEDEAETGVTIMQMDAGLDTGAILSQAATPITARDNAQSLHDRLAQLGADLLIRTLPGYVAGRIPPTPQPSTGATYARKITKDDGRLDWTRPARELWNRVRGLTPWPGTFTYLPAQPRPVMLKIWQAEIAEAAAGIPGQIVKADAEGLIVACGQQGLRLMEIQREGGRRLATGDFLAGHPLGLGLQLGNPPTTADG